MLNGLTTAQKVITVGTYIVGIPIALTILGSAVYVAGGYTLMAFHDIKKRLTGKRKA
jgi:hypothetical protein